MATAEAANKGGEGNDGAGAEGASKIGVCIRVRGAVTAAEAAKGEGVTEGGNDGAGAEGEGASTIGVCIGVCGAVVAAIGSGETGLIRIFVVATAEAVDAKVISDRAIPSSSLSTLILVVGS